MSFLVGAQPDVLVNKIGSESLLESLLESGGQDARQCKISLTDTAS
jgi:hypothetical protein